MNAAITSARRFGWSSETKVLASGIGLDPCVGDRLRQALRVGELEEAVLGRPGEQGRPVELAESLGGLQRVALVQSGGDLGRVAPDPGVTLRGLHPAVDQLGRDLGLREWRERRPAKRRQAERQRHHGHRARQLGQGRHQLEGRGREVLVRVAVGQHQPADSLRAPRREHLRDRPAAVVANDRHAVQLHRLEEVGDHVRDPRGREVGIGVHRHAMGAHRPVREDAAVRGREVLGGLAPQPSVDQVAVHEDDRLALAQLSVADHALRKADLLHRAARLGHLSLPGSRFHTVST